MTDSGENTVKEFHGSSLTPKLKITNIVKMIHISNGIMMDN